MQLYQCKVEPQWLEHLWDYGLISFEIWVVRATEEANGDNFMEIFLIFYTIILCGVYSLESPLRGDSNGYTKYKIP